MSFTARGLVHCANTSRSHIENTFTFFDIMQYYKQGLAEQY